MKKANTHNLTTLFSLVVHYGLDNSGKIILYKLPATL